MIQNEKISVIVPIYNAQNYLDENIQSLISQTYNNLEIILVNDGSQDHSQEIIKQWATKDNRIICINQENQGVTAARKNGIAAASGSWIYFTDADDTLPVDAIEKLHKAKDCEDIIVGQIQQIGGNAFSFPKFDATLSNVEYANILLNRKKIHWGPVAKLIRKDLFNDFVLDIPKFVISGEDFLMNLRLASLCNSVKVTSCPVYNYIKREGSATSKDPWLSMLYCIRYEILVAASLNGIRLRTLLCFTKYSLKTGYIRLRHKIATIVRSLIRKV